MTVLLDTQVLLTLGLEGFDTMPRRVRNLLADFETKRLVSTVSIMEIAVKESIGKIEATPEQVSRMIADLKLEVISYRSRHAMQMFGLPLHHREPFDRMLIATAIAEDIPLVGGDARFPAYKQQGLSVIWK